VIAILAVLALRSGGTRYPILAWMPWIVWILIRCPLDFVAVQRTAMLLLSPIAAVAAAKACTKDSDIQFLLRSLASVVLFVGVVVICDSFFLMPFAHLQRPAAILILCMGAAYYTPGVYKGQTKPTVLWLWCVAVCAISNGRTVAAITIMTLMMCPEKIGVYKRLAAASLVVVLALAVFSLPTMRAKMSHSQNASLAELIRGEEQLNTSGRLNAWELYLHEAMREPLFGLGGNSSGEFGRSNIGSLDSWHHPHNEYIRILFEYGAIGLLCFLGAHFYCVVNILKTLRQTQRPVVREALMLSLAGMTMFFLLCLTENVLLYATFFGMFLFGIMGAAYGLSNTSRQYESHMC
jgi:O-antigen ligase